MSLDFMTLVRPSWEVIRAIERLHPGIAFHSARYVAAKMSLGLTPLAMVFYEGQRLVAGSTAFLRGRRAARHLEIPSLTPMPDWEQFRHGLSRVCRREMAWKATIDTYGAPLPVPSGLPGRVTKRPRLEHILPLDDRIERLGATCAHRVQIKRARCLGLSLVRSREPEALVRHAEAITSSMLRRRLRGESVPDYSDFTAEAALLQSQAGELFQIVDQNVVHASAFVITSAEAGYYHSAGVTSIGRHSGASHYLVCQISEALRNEGMKVLNLGGAAPDNPGLLRFKERFGAIAVPLEAAQLDLVPEFIRRSLDVLRGSAEWLRAIPRSSGRH